MSAVFMIPCSRLSGAGGARGLRVRNRNYVSWRPVSIRSPGRAGEGLAPCSRHECGDIGHDRNGTTRYPDREQACGCIRGTESGNLKKPFPRSKEIDGRFSTR